MKTGCIYRIWHRDSGLSYIGQTTQDVKKRIKRHFDCIDDCYLHNAIKKHGIDAFDWEIIQSDIHELILDEREIYLINHFDCIRPNGYNLTLGGEGTRGFRHSDETKKKISAINKGRKVSAEARAKMSESRKGEKHPNYGKQHSEESKKKMSESKLGNTYTKGRKSSDETRRKISEARKGTKASAETRAKISASGRGRKFSDEHKRKIGEAHRGKQVSAETRRKISNIKTGKPSGRKGKRNTKRSSNLQLYMKI